MKGKAKKNQTARTDLTVDEFVQLCCEGNAAIRRVCETATESDPPLVFVWRNEREFVQGIPSAPAHLSPPFELGPSPSEEEFKDALLAHVRVPGAAAAVERAVLPCSLGEACAACANLARLEHDEWFVAVAAQSPAAVPIANVVVPRQRRRRASGTATAAVTVTVSAAVVSPPTAPCRLWG